MMFWPARLFFKLAFRVRLLILSAVAGLLAGLFLQLREQQQSWAVVPRDQGRQLPGDDLLPVADISETRTLPIAAAPDQVWPWLVQMGWGRGGWYSYDQIDMDTPSADSILADFQDLAEGDMVPTDPSGGFVAKVVEPGQALVLYLDTELATGQGAAAEETATDDAEGGDEAAGEADEDLPPGLKVAGAMGGMAMPDFRGTWAFVLEPDAGGGTRLIERMRVWSDSDGLPQRLGMPLMGLGVFTMTRKHMLGVQERAERLAKESGEPEPIPAEA